MRTTLAVVVALVSLAEVGSRAVFPDEPAAKATPATKVWDGYVWKDGEGRLRLGWGVVAMGIMGERPHVIEGPAAERLAKHALAKEDWVFWNYSLERPDAEMLKGLPLLLVRLEGVVTEDPSTDPPNVQSFPPSSAVRMKEARVAMVEFVKEAWLKAWAVWFREKASPWRIRDDTDGSAAGQKAFATKGLASLEAMRAVPGPGDADKAEAQKLGKDVRVVERFRKSTEADLQRWLVETSKEKGWALPGLDRLPPLPPTSTEVQGWFLAESTKDAFLKRVAKAWTGDLGLVELSFYDQNAGSSWADSVDVERLRDAWTEADYTRHKKITQELLGGR